MSAKTDLLIQASRAFQQTRQMSFSKNQSVDQLSDECRILTALRVVPEIFERLAETRGSELAVQSALRRQFPDELVRAALLIHDLRKKAATKFRHADRMWFDRQGLEQSTNELISQYKAKRFQGAVWDLCCGVGGDAIALAGHCDVTAVDLNPAACLRASWNAEVYGVDQRLKTVCADVLEFSETSGLVHIDPDRRPGSSGRVSRIEDYVPGLDYLQRMISRMEGGAIKIGPASNFGGKFPDAEIELISLNGECKEATVWFGSLAGPELFRATVLPSGESLAGHPMQAAAPIMPLGAYLYDPDPAVVRAGLVDLLAERLGLARLDAAEEYLTSDQLVLSPFVQPFEVLCNLPNNERELKAWLRQADIGNLEIKCRHIPIQADSLRRKLRPSGTASGVAIFARLEGKARIVGARRPIENGAAIS